MELALKAYPNEPLAQPEGIVNVSIDKQTGLAVPTDSPGSVNEIFREENAPEVPLVSDKQIEQITEDLFE